MLKAIVFDFDGVIVDSEPLHYRAFAKLGREIGKAFSYEEYLEKYLGYDDRDVLRCLMGLPVGQKADAAVERRIAELKGRKQDYFEAGVREGVEVMPGMRALIEAAGREMPLAIGSGATRRDIALILEGMKLEGRFEVIVTADDVTRSKPDPETYATAAAKLAERHPELGLTPAHCLSIEDTDAGIEAARRAGLMTLGVGTTCPVERLRLAQRVVGSPRELTLGRLREWFNA